MPSRTLLCALAFLAFATGAWAQSPAFSRAQTATGNQPDSVLNRIDVFVGLDGSKQPQDLGINANMGPRTSINAGIPVVTPLGIGAQVGAAVNFSDAAVHVLDQVEGTSRRTQVFTTVGLFQRQGRVSWGIGYDLLRQYYFDDTWLAQVRGELGIAVAGSNQLGLRLAAPTRKADAAIAATAIRLEPIAQATAVARHSWESGAVTGIWVGVARGHHNVVLVFPDNSKDRNVLVYGAEVAMPLNDRWTINGATNLITPTATGTVDAYMGVTVNLGRGRERPSQFAPVLDVTNNTSFSVDLSRR